MPGKLSIPRMFWKCCCGLCDSFNILLSISACLLTIIILLNSMGKVIPIPETLTRWTVDKVMSDHIHVDWSRAVFDLRGGLFLEDITITNKETEETFLTAETARVDFAIFNLMTGFSSPIGEIGASRILFFLPAGYSPSGLNEGIVFINNLSADMSGGDLLLHGLQLDVGGLSANISGQGSLRDLSSGGGGEKSGNTLNVIYNALSKTLRLSPELEANLNVTWLRPGNGDHLINSKIIVPTLASEAASLERMYGEASLAVGSGTIRYYRMETSGYLSAFGDAENLDFLGDLELERPLRLHLSAIGKPVRLGTIPMPSNLDITISSPGYPLKFFDLVHLSTSLDSDSPVLNGIFTGPHLFLSTEIVPDVPGGVEGVGAILNNPVRAELDLDLSEARLDYFFPQYPKMRLLDGTKASSFRFRGDFFSRSLSLDGMIFADDFHVGATDFSHVFSRLLIDSKSLSISNGQVQIALGESAVGSYHHHFPSSSFTLLAAGQTFPESLDALLGKWWINVFKNLRADQPAYGDVAVWGQWRDLPSIQSLTDAYAERAYFRDYPIRHLEVRVRSSHRWVQLHRFLGIAGGGSILGSIDWQLVRDPTKRKPMLLDFTSNAPWEGVVAASGVGQLANYAVTGNPDVKAEGIIWLPPKENKELPALPYLKVYLGAFGETFQTGSLVFKDLSLRGRVGPKDIDFDSVYGGFADGIVTGSMSIFNWPDPEKRSRHLKLDAFDTNYRDAVMELTELMEDPDSLRSALISETTSGRADAVIDLHLYESLSLCEGLGTVNVRQADIGKVHILGGLSRSLSGMGMGFSSMDLRAAGLDWRLQNGIFEIVNCNVSGPVLNLDVGGQIDLLAKQIALKANVLAFRGIFSQVFAPVGESLKFDLTGDFENPSWQVRMDPFKWFKNRIPDDPAPAEL